MYVLRHTRSMLHSHFAEAMCPAILVSAFLFPSLVSAAILTTYSPANLLPPLPRPLLSLSQNATNTTTLTPNGIRFQCDGNYGRIANPSSCLDLFEYIATSDTQATFSDRHTGHPSDVPLPWRVSGSSGLCFLQALLVPGAASGHASSKQVGQAGYVVFQRCVVERGIGGIAENVGGDNKINVVIATYEPRVRCDRTAVKGPPWESCLLISLDMEASKERMVFGNKAADPRVQVNLPVIYKASMFEPLSLACWEGRSGTNASLPNVQSTQDVNSKSTSPGSQQV